MKKMRVGVFGVGRGMSLANVFMLLDAEIVAICDNHQKRREAAMAKLDKSVAVYESFDEFIDHPMDVVILANNFYQHAPYAVECFKRNLHVFSECISNGTMGEGVELVRAFEKSKSIYMLAENYPQMLFNREMKRVADSGTLGKILYAEGEYNHPPHPFDIYSATAMSSVAILGHRSVLDGGKLYDIPDFRKEEDRKIYENDYLTLFWGDDGSEPTLPCCSNPDYKPTEKQMELYLEELKK